mgnify:FL=1
MINKTNKIITIPTNLECNKGTDGMVNLVKLPNSANFFFSCSNYPKCKGNRKTYFGDIEDIDKIENCPHCDGITYVARGKYGPFYTCTNYRDGCKGKSDIGRNCPRCGSPLTRQINRKTGKEYIKCSKRGCMHRE